MNDYIIYIDKPGRQFKRVIKKVKTLEQALTRYIRELPESVANNCISTLKYECVNSNEVFV